MGTGQKIKNAAIELFSKKGYNAVSTREIAGMAGISVAMVHYHFTSKEMLLESILTDAIQVFEGIEHQLQPEEPIFNLHHIINECVYKSFRHWKIVYILFHDSLIQERPSFRNAYITIKDKIITLLDQNLEAGEKKHLLKRVPGVFLFYTVLGTINMLIIRLANDFRNDIISGRSTVKDISRLRLYLLNITDSLVLK